MIKIVTYPDKLLKKKSQEIENVNSDILSIIEKLILTLDSFNHCVGIAAVQIGYLVRAIAVDISKTKNKNHGRLIMLNPTIITSSTDNALTKEGCLSVPEYLAYVLRPKKTAVKYLDINGKECIIEAKRFEAVVIQHEIDHLDGVLFIDKVASSKDILKRQSDK